MDRVRMLAHRTFMNTSTAAVRLDIEGLSMRAGDGSLNPACRRGSHHLLIDVSAKPKRRPAACSVWWSVRVFEQVS